MMNIREELGYFLPKEKRAELVARRLLGIEHCSDYSILTPNVALLGHNEDSGFSDVNTTFMISATLIDDNGDVESKFTS